MSRTMLSFVILMLYVCPVAHADKRKLKNKAVQGRRATAVHNQLTQAFHDRSYEMRQLKHIRCVINHAVAHDVPRDSIENILRDGFLLVRHYITPRHPSQRRIRQKLPGICIVAATSTGKGIA